MANYLVARMIRTGLHDFNGKELLEYAEYRYCKRIDSARNCMSDYVYNAHHVSATLDSQKAWRDSDLALSLSHPVVSMEIVTLNNIIMFRSI